MSRYSEAQAKLRQSPKTWLVTGVAGFIGSHLLENLLRLDQEVVGLDDFSTGHRRNIEEVRGQVTPAQWARFRMIEEDICDPVACRDACAGADVVLHQAALGSVPRSIENPLRTHEVNVTGFLNMLVASREAHVGRFVYAASSSTYGDHPDSPKRESRIGNPLSPYAVTKLANELYADVFARCYGFRSIGLRYFNVFGPRQDPNGAYAAVIPRWFAGMLGGGEVFINGDGETSRDFCFVDNAVQANILAAVIEDDQALGEVYNVAFGAQTTLNRLFEIIRDLVVQARPDIGAIEPTYRDFRTGDVRHSLADISKAADRLGYAPAYSVRQGMEMTCQWYGQHLEPSNPSLAQASS